jgi:long-chain acyl-CoA synthetase
MTIPGDLQKFYPLPKFYDPTISTQEAPGFEKVEGETIPRRNYKNPEALKWQPHPDVSTVHDIMRYAAKTYGNAKGMGSRKLIKMHRESKMIKKVVDGQETEVEKTWQYWELSGFSYISFQEFETLALQIGAGLRKLGLTAGDKVHLFAATQYVAPC